jgi:hypothetical protein
MHLTQHHLPPVGRDVPRAVEMGAHLGGNRVDSTAAPQARAEDAEQARCARYPDDEIPIVERKGRGTGRRNEKLEKQTGIPVARSSLHGTAVNP